MKTIYIPKGETVRYESIETENLIVKGCLEVAYGVKAKTISGSGIIHAESIAADVIRADELEASIITCKRLIAKRVDAPEVFASDSAAVSCLLSAAYVETGRLTVALSAIDQVCAEEVINLTPKKRGLLGTLVASAFRAFFLSLFAAPVKPAPGKIMDAEFRQVDEAPAGAPEPAHTDVPEASATDVDAEDQELRRFIAMFKLMRESGLTLKVVPGTPEENAPVFGFGEKSTMFPAA